MKGLIFTEPMFYAVIEVRKTQTRRIINPQPDIIRSIANDLAKHPGYEISEKTWTPAPAFHFLMSGSKFLDPRYKVGESVYIKEPFHNPDDFLIYYKYGTSVEWNSKIKWKNPRMMAARQARFFIEITDVRCERVADISDEDCLMEGVKCFEQPIEHRFVYCYDVVPSADNGHVKYVGFNTPRDAYAALFDKINGKGSFERNPYVFVYEYKLIK